MGKKGALTAVFSRSRSRSRSGVDSPPWPWPSCGDPQTDSFRDGGGASAASGSRCGPVAARHRRLVGAAGGEMYKTVNSVYFDPDDGESCSGLNAGEDEEEEWVVVDDDGFSTATACAEEEWSEAVIRSLSRTTSSTDRFFFDQGRPATNSILPAAAASVSSLAGSTPLEDAAALSEKETQPAPGDGGKSLVVEESMAVAAESADPYQNFLASMEEMVAAHGLRGWDALEELLMWYLRVNAKRHHPLIVSAFVDLLLGLTGTPSTTSTTTTTATTSSSSISTSSSASMGSSKSTSTSTTTSTSSDVIAAAATEQCRGGKEAPASCSSSSSTCVPSGLDEAGRGEE